MEHTITIIKGQREWLAQHSDPSVRELFGTDTLPTPFLLSMDPIEVQLELTRLNPDVWVKVQL